MTVGIAMNGSTVGKQTGRSGVCLVLLSALAAAVLGEIVFLLAFTRGVVAEDAMAPHFAAGDRILVERLSPLVLDYRPGEAVAVATIGTHVGLGALRRVVAVPGMAVGRRAPLVLGPDEYLLAPLGGDHWDAAAPRVFTVVSRGTIQGRVILRTAPLARFAWRPGRADEAALARE